MFKKIKIFNCKKQLEKLWQFQENDAYNEGHNDYSSKANVMDENEF
jgi:hypothetical protein